MKKPSHRGELIVNVLSLPRKLKTLSHVSLQELLKRTGYFKAYTWVTEASLRVMLKRHPEYIDDWVAYSEDKRASTGWYIKRAEMKLDIVGFYSDQVGRRRDTTYLDPIAACAAFIKHEIEDMRTCAVMR